MPECAHCGEVNPEIARFCLACGAPLEPQTRLGAEERKMVTVLFCDLVGFTSASDRADPEDVRARIRPYHATLRREIVGYGGTVEKFIGDAVMGVFGAPVAHEDDPERAVRAGLRILEAIADLNERAGLDLQVRVGIETGEAMVALGARVERGEGIVTGDVVNTASRLQGAAPPHGVAVGPGTYDATQAIFDYDALEPVTLKGKAEPVPIFHATGARARFGTDLTRSVNTELVGRQIDLGILKGAFQKAVQESTVQLVAIVGEPGVGKSRLAVELFRFLDESQDLIRWRQGRCLPYGEGITFWALGEIVKAEAGILETDPPDTAVAKIEAVVPEENPDAPWLRQRLRPLVGLDAPEAAREENFAAWRAFLELLAEDRPSVFVFEDLHWADDALLAFVEHLAEFGVGVPMLVLGTARPELFERAPGWAASARNAARVNLSSLSETETARLISNLLESAVLPVEVQRAIVERSGGNPLYAEEFVGLLKDKQILTRAGGSWTTDPDARIPVPAGVQGLIAARLDTLPPERKRLLQDAAVIGKVFWLGAVAEIGDQPPEAVRAALHELARGELVRPIRRSSMERQVEYAFAHALVRDVCYAQIPRAQRSERHRLAAAWIEKVGGERVEDQAEFLAAHCTTALELAQATEGPEVEELAAKAVRYLVLAGDRAMGIDAEIAERHYARALKLTGRGHSQRAEVLARHGEALRQRARFAEAAKAFEQAIDEFHAAGNVRSAAIALGRYRLSLLHMGDPRHGDPTAEALTLLEPLGPSPELVLALTAHAGRNAVSDNHQEAIALADRALKLASQLGLPEPARALGFRGLARVGVGQAAGLDDMRRALAAAVDQGVGRDAAILYYNLAECLGFVEGPRVQLEMLRQGTAFAERRGIVEGQFGLAAQTTSALVDLGSYDEAIALAAKLASQMEGAGDVLNLLELRRAQVRVLARRGAFAQAGPIASWTIQRSRELGDPQYLSSALAVGAAARLGTGDAAGARAILEELERIPEARQAVEYGASLPEAVRTALAADSPELAARLPADFEPTRPIHDHALVSVRALICEHRGDHAEAAALFADAAARWKRFEVPWECAQALLGRGRCLLAIGQPSEASESLREAREMLAALAAIPALAYTDALLDQATALSA